MSWTSPLTALPHLSDEAVAAFADGVLSDTARQRAQSHMAGCAECSDAVYGQRAARAALRSAGRPKLPDGLFERLRELPITAELPSMTVASALSADGQPLFASFSAPPAELMVAPSRAEPAPVVAGRDAGAQPPAPHQVDPGQLEARPARPAPPLAPMPTPHPLALPPHRHTSTRVGLGATAAAVLAVGVLVTTAANAGGVTPTTRIVQPSATDRPGSVVPAVQVPMHMTLLSVPSTGR